MWKDDAYLLDILLNAEDAISFVSGMTFKDFLYSKLHQNAVIRCLEVIGEASGKISPDFKNNHPDIAWTKMSGLRNRLIHAYSDVNLEIVWSVIETELPQIAKYIGPLVPPEDKL